MLPPEDRRALEAGLKKATFIWAAILVSLGVYVFVAHFLNQQRAELVVHMPDDTYQLLRYALSGIGLAGLAAARFLRGLIIRRAAESGEAGHEAALAAYARAVIVSLALAEILGPFGLVLFLLSGDFTVLYVFVAFSVAGMVVYRPQFEELAGLAEAMARRAA